MSESDIQRQIVDALRAVGGYPIRIQSGRVKVARGWMTLAPAGTPDVLVLLPRGRCLWLEVKDAKGRLRASQEAWRANVSRLGQLVATVRSPQEAVRAYLDACDAGDVGD